MLLFSLTLVSFILGIVGGVGALQTVRAIRRPAGAGGHGRLRVPEFLIA